MRRKRDRTAATKKPKAAEEVNTEKVKRISRGRRRKQSISSDESSVESTTTPQQPTETVTEVDKPPKTPLKEDSPEEKQDQVWQVKTTEVSVETGEIQKLKICLTRPPSTPERLDRSPRIKRKHSRATSSSDTPSVEGVEEKRKSSRLRTKYAARESKDDPEKDHDSQGEEPEVESEAQTTSDNVDNEVTQSTESKEESVTKDDEKQISTTGEDCKSDKKSEVSKLSEKKFDDNIEIVKTSDADTTVVQPSPRLADQYDGDECEKGSSVDQSETKESQDKKEENKYKDTKDVDKEENASQKKQEEPASSEKVSKSEDKTADSVSDEPESSQGNVKESNESDVVVSSERNESKTSSQMSTDSDKDNDKRGDSRDESQVLEHSISTQEEPVHNGQATPIVINRKRKWGSRPSKITTQKSITISTDILKEIIPNVKPAEFEEVIEEKKPHRRIEIVENDGPILPKIVIDNTTNLDQKKSDFDNKDNARESHLGSNRKISIVKDNDNIIAKPPSPPRHKQSCILYITNLVRPFTLPQLKNLLQRTGRIVEDGFWIDRIKSKCYVKYEREDQAVETRHALHGVTWPVSNPKTLQVDFSSLEAFDKAKATIDNDNLQTSTIPGTVEDWLREQDLKRERGELEKPWERKALVREWDMGKGDTDKDKLRKDDRSLDRRRHRTPERSPEPAKKFKKKEEEAPAKLLDDLFRKTKTTPCIYWLPLSAETIAIKEEQRRQHMAEHERRLQELRRTHRRH